MRFISGEDFIRIWEVGQGQNSTQRAFFILGIAFPERDSAELLAMPVGRRDRLLLALREKNLGRRLDCRADCPACGTSLEFALDTRALSALAPAAHEPLPVRDRVTVGEYELEFRLPANADLLEAAECESLNAAREVLLRRCVISCTKNGSEAEEIPSIVRAELESEILRRDPLAEVKVNLRCAGCANAWSMLFDIAAFLWTEISNRALRLLGEVHRLARAYGWSESQILGLSRARRRSYLELLHA